MSATAPTAVNRIAFRQDEGEALWFLGVLATIKASRETTDGRVAVIEHLAPQGAGSPLHVHHNEDEWFYVTEGELTFWVGGQLIDAPAGSVTSRNRASDDVTVKVWAIPRGPYTNDPAGASISRPPTQKVSSPSVT